MEEDTLYQKFAYHMEKIGLRKESSILEEKDVVLSDNDEVIYIVIPKTETSGSGDNRNSYSTISIKGIKDSSVRGRVVVCPHYISLKVYGYDGEEVKPGDTVQFSITEFRKGLPSVQESSSHTVYYHYAYRIASEKLRLKKGIIITKDRRLEIRIMRDGNPIKIGKIDIRIECDKWYTK